MKKHILPILLLLLPSCLDNGSQKITIASQPAVAEKTEKSIIMHISGMAIEFSKDYDKFDNGDCCLLDFTIESGLLDQDSKLPRPADILSYTDVTKYTSTSTLQDTLKILPNEKTISKIQQRHAYIKGQFFVFSEHSITDSLLIVNNFSLSYDATASPKIEESGRRIYDLFLRTTKEKDGAKTSEKVFLLSNAFDLTKFVEEKSKIEKDTLFFRINYVSNFNKDTTKIERWGTELFQLVK